MRKYYLEFILNMEAPSSEVLKNSLLEFAEVLEITQLPQDNDSRDKDFRIRVYTEDPTIIFDTCAQFGRLKSIKIDESKGHPSSQS